MSAGEFDSIEELFHAALQRPHEERERFLAEACGENAALRDELRTLLHHHDATRAFVDESPIYSLWPDDAPAAVSTGGTLDTAAAGYRIVRMLGEGGMGLVYLAEQTRPIHRQVALKMIKLGIDSKQVRARFESERQALALMNHPNIARVYEAGVTSEGQLYFAMEYIDGVPITDYCDRMKMTVRARIALFVEVCQALHHAHQKGIIHRDIKPTNILVSCEDSRATPKIIDFGVAKATNQRLVEQTLYTQHGILVGSLAYMSPEQADPLAADIDTRSDIYSLGVVLYELLTGCHPLGLDHIGRLTYGEIEHRIRDRHPALPSRAAVLGRREGNATGRGGKKREADGCVGSEGSVKHEGNPAIDIAMLRSTSPEALARELRGDLDWIVAKALAKEATERYSSASEFAADIERHLNNEPVLASPPSRRYRMCKFVARNRRLVTAVSAVAVALVLGFATSTSLYMQNRRTTRLAQEQRDDIFALSDVNRLRTCIAQADSLGPPYPEFIPEMEAWLQGPARELVERLPYHRENLSELERLGKRVRLVVPVPAGEIVLPNKGRGINKDADTDTPGYDSANEAAVEWTYQFEDLENQFQYDILSSLVADLESFVDPDPYVGAVAEVRQRVDLAKRIRHETIESYAGEWAAAVAAIADSTMSPAYHGLRLEPQVGLVPIGPDPESGLWEFAVPATGEPPRRDANGRLMLKEESGVVLVLVPGGCFWMGASREAGPNVPRGDEWAEYKEEPVHRVCLGPFFIAKYEVTQAVWERLTGVNPSGSRPGVQWEDYVQTLLHPVEEVNWFEVMAVMRSVGLELPTEAQWEYAARAGARTRYPWGWERECLAAHANIVDQCAKRNHKPPVWNFQPWDDGYVETSPVGSFLPNRFGLYDVTGNVSEWCRDPYGYYEMPVAPGDGARIARSEVRVARGGDWATPAFAARVARRPNIIPSSSENIGLRPSRAVVGEH